VLLAVAGLLEAVGKTGEAIEAACKVVQFCAKSTPVPPQPANSSLGPPQTAKPASPQIADYSTDWVDGGRGLSTNDYCNPRKQALEKQYPELNIEMIPLPEQHRSQYNPFKHDQYKYGCSFKATAK
jgi:hypothetical protein